MEEACQNDLFTDVTLEASGKEFKAHKVVLASQSQFLRHVLLVAGPVP